MRDKDNIIALLKAYKEKNSNEFGIKKMGIFGSVAQGSFGEGSDVDIVVLFSKRNLLNRIGLKLSLEEFLGMPVDLVAYRDNMNPLLKVRIEKDVIYV